MFRSFLLATPIVFAALTAQAQFLNREFLVDQGQIRLTGEQGKYSIDRSDTADKYSAAVKKVIGIKTSNPLSTTEVTDRYTINITKANGRPVKILEINSSYGAGSRGTMDWVTLTQDSAGTNLIKLAPDGTLQSQTYCHAIDERGIVRNKAASYCRTITPALCNRIQAYLEQNRSKLQECERVVREAGDIAREIKSDAYKKIEDDNVKELSQEYEKQRSGTRLNKTETKPTTAESIYTKYQNSIRTLNDFPDGMLDLTSDCRSAQRSFGYDTKAGTTAPKPAAGEP